MFGHLSPGSKDLLTATSARAGRISRLLLWGALGLLLIGASLLLDVPVARALTIDSHPLLRSLAHFISHLGEGWLVATVGALGAILLALLGRTQAARIVFLVAAVGLLTGATATVLRSLIGRTRPNAHIPQGVYGIRYDSHWIIGKSEFASFPSGHAATVVGLAAAAWLCNRRFGLAAGVYAALVSWSRLAQGVHHFSDIVAACILGAAGAQILLPSTNHWLGFLQRVFDKARCGPVPNTCHPRLRPLALRWWQGDQPMTINRDRR
ncbi:MAG TPA: phosphatase PAP2 family protein [Candidatus Limnocylindrales bacterium]|nr:phosphatase PAP2 family protein [Candidatus Limnocylindrales bacterium]